MAIKTVSSHRTRTELKVIQGVNPSGVQDAYESYEAAKAADATKTWTVRVVSAFALNQSEGQEQDFVIVAEASYPEVNETPTGQVPEEPEP